MCCEIGACTIPVIIADGLTLPFEQLIDWDDLVIRISDEKANDANWILKQIERFNEAEINRKATMLCNIYDKYFSTSKRRWQGLLDCAFEEILKIENPTIPPATKKRLGHLFQRSQQTMNKYIV